VTCPHCGDPVIATGRRDRIYCTETCRQRARYARRKAGAPPPPWTHQRRWEHPALTSEDTTLRAAALRAQQLGEAHGWSPSTIRCAMDGLTVLLAGRATGEPVTATEIRTRTPRRASNLRVAEVLSELELLADDTTPAIRSWIERRTGELPAGFAADIRAWLLVLLDGDARARPRSQSSLYVYFGTVRPFIERWAADRSHLREITTADIDTVLKPLRGNQLRNAISALRSLLRFAKKSRLVFTDPTTRLTVPTVEPTVLPMTEAEVRAVEQIAVTPAQRLVVALAAVHAARAAPIRHLTLDDVDLPNRRITIAGHPQRLGELPHRALLAWLEHRRATWPLTANRHVLISQRTALGTGPVCHYYLKRHLLLRGVHLEHIRADRVLHEALTVGPDPLHLALVFNLSHTTANRYAAIAQKLLDDQLEHPAPSCTSGAGPDPDG
jgi:integrase